MHATVSDVELDAVAARVTDRQVDPHTAAAQVLARVYPEGALDHIGIAVDDLEAATACYRDALGLDVSEPHEVPSEQVRARFVPVGQTSLELLEATAASSAIARFVDKRGPGLHHVTLLVDDIAGALARLKSRGVRLVDEVPRPGAHGSAVAFIHPSAAQGVLIELKQAAPGGSR